MAALSAQYAKALFELALEQDMAEAFHAQAILMRDCLQVAECRRALAHPLLSTAEKRALFGSAFAGSVHDDLIGLLYLAIDKGREADLVPALGRLIGMFERYQSRETAEVLSAAALDDAQIAELEGLLSAKFSSKVKVSLDIDPSLIAGPYIRIGGYLIDLTVKKRLRDMTDSMKERCGA